MSLQTIYVSLDCLGQKFSSKKDLKVSVLSKSWSTFWLPKDNLAVTWLYVDFSSGCSPQWVVSLVLRRPKEYYKSDG